MSSVKKHLVYSPVLAFVLRFNKYDELVAKAVQNFEADMLIKAKDELWQLAPMSTRSADRVRPQDMGADRIRDIQICDEKRVVFPKFVIYEPYTVPILSGDVTATLTRQVHKLYFTVDNLIDHLG